MKPIAKNILVVDESGKSYASTYAKRAQGLVKHGRARWLDEQTICLACPPDTPDTINLEDTEMDNNNESRIDEIEQAQEEEMEQDVQSKAGFTADELTCIDQFALRRENAPVTAREILERIDRIIAQGDEMAGIVESICSLPITDSMPETGDIAARVEAIERMVSAREETNRRQTELLREMYADVRKPDPLSAKKEILEMLHNMSFDSVSPETVKNLLDFYQHQLDNL